MTVAAAMYIPYHNRLPYLKEQLGEGVLERVEEKEGWEPLHRYVVSIVGEDKTAPANTSELK